MEWFLYDRDLPHERVHGIVIVLDIKFIPNFKFVELWKNKTRVASFDLPVQIHELRVQLHELRVQIHELGD